VPQRARGQEVLGHPRRRTRERTALANASLDALSVHLPLLEKQISNVWSGV
jgi:hypothetical protein